MNQLTGLVLYGGRSTDAGVKHLASFDRAAGGRDIRRPTDRRRDGCGPGRFKTLARSALAARTFPTMAWLLKDLANLENLYLERCKVTGDGFKDLSHLAKLNYLRIAGTRLTDEGLREISRLPALKDLWIDGTSMSRRGLHYLRDRRSLSTLLANDTPVDDEGLKEIGQMKGLTELQLKNTQITSVGLRTLPAWRKCSGCRSRIREWTPPEWAI